MFKLGLGPHLLKSAAGQLVKKKKKRDLGKPSANCSLDICDLFIHPFPDPAAPADIFIKPRPSLCASHYFNLLLHLSVWLLQAKLAGYNSIV